MTYNRELKEFRDSKEHSITEKLGNVTEVTPQILLRNSVTLSNIMQVIEMSWIQLQEKWPDQVAEGLDNLKIFQLRPRVDVKDGEKWLFFDSCCVGRGLSEDQTKEITQIITDFVKDDSTLKTMHGFLQTKRKLEDRGRRLTNEIGKVVRSINDDQYSTIVECCKKIRSQY